MRTPADPPPPGAGAHTVTFRGNPTRQPITVRVDEHRRVSATLPGTGDDALTAGEMLAALGAAPPWLPHLRMVAAALDRDPDVSVEEVLAHLKTPPSQRARLAARAHTLPVGRVWMLALDPDQYVRDQLADHFPEPECYDPVAVFLLDGNEYARNLLLRRVTWSTALDRAAATHADPRVRAALVRRHPDRVPEDLFAALAADPDPTVRRLLASKRQLPPALVDRLAGDPEREVRFAVARAQPLTEHAARVLAADPLAGVGETLLRNRSCPESVRRAMEAAKAARDATRDDPDPT